VGKQSVDIPGGKLGFKFSKDGKGIKNRKARKKGSISNRKVVAMYKRRQKTRRKKKRQKKSSEKAFIAGRRKIVNRQDDALP
jgi:hypothetical protein